MVTLGVITSFTWWTKWVSSLTYFRMPGGTLHICLYPRDLNKVIVWEHYRALTFNEISHWPCSAMTISKQDPKDGFWSNHLNEKSSYCPTFNTHKGRYQFLHMPFSLKMFKDVFQMCMGQVTDHLPGIITIYNDICIFSETPEEHDRHLIQLMQTALKNGIIFNSSKCRIRQSEIIFYSAVFTSWGMKPNSTKVHTLQDLTTSSNQTKLQSFLGLIKYLQLFNPGLTDNTMPCKVNSLSGIGSL